MTQTLVRTASVSERSLVKIPRVGQSQWLVPHPALSFKLVYYARQPCLH